MTWKELESLEITLESSKTFHSESFGAAALFQEMGMGTFFPLQIFKRFRLAFGSLSHYINKSTPDRQMDPIWSCSQTHNHTACLDNSFFHRISSFFSPRSIIVCNWHSLAVSSCHPAQLKTASQTQIETTIKIMTNRYWCSLTNKQTGLAVWNDLRWNNRFPFVCLKPFSVIKRRFKYM